MDDTEKGTATETVEIARSALHDLIQKCQLKNFEKKYLYMEESVMQIVHCPDSERKILRRKLHYFKSDFFKKWSKALRTKKIFLQQNEQWLQGTVILPKWIHLKSGRPPKSFTALSERSKRRKTQELRSEVPADELTFAASVSQRAIGNTDVFQIIKDVTATPTRATKFKKIIRTSQKLNIVKHTPTTVLSHFVEADLTRKQYEVIQSANKAIYPCYPLLQKAKNECYLKKYAITITETLAEVKLQDLLDHTIIRLCKYLEDLLNRCSKEELQNLELISKWGCGGSQQSQFKQKFLNSLDSDANIFQSSLVPLRLISKIDNKEKTLWQNPVPSSPRFCRPIRIQFVRETTAETIVEKSYIENQVNNLQVTEICHTDYKIRVKHILLFTMVDAKICNSLTCTKSTTRCYVCGLTSKDFNNLTKSRPADTEAINFGLSILHARIRVFESFLHLSYKLPLKKWRCPKKNIQEKQITDETKCKIQKAFKEELGLLVDIPKSGFGNTNDGNTSRRFFENAEISSRITGLDFTLIKRLKIILEAISSGHLIDTLKFSQYASDTAQLYVSLYPWHPMTPTLHKLLVHGEIIIKNSLLPIGLSEEAAEARNKHLRRYRYDIARKFSREVCNRDVLNRLLLTSDPFLSSIRPKPIKRSKPFSSETLQLLLPGARNQTDSETYKETDNLLENSEQDSDSD